ncbi:MAG: flagellar biosynthesis protein FlhB [Vicinamibacterales bacterium]
MADEQQHGEKTEKPSAKKLRDARKRGEVPRSPDLVAALSLVAVTVVLLRSGAAAMVRLQTHLSESLSGLADRAAVGLTPEALGVMAVEDGGLLAVLAAPVMVTAALAGLAGNVAQSGWVFAPERLTPNFTRLSPSHGWQRIKPIQSGMTLVKAILACSVVGALAWSVGREALAETPRLAWMAPESAALEGWGWLRRLLLQGGAAQVLLAGADVGWQWWRYYANLKMTKQEVRDEAKSSDGNPEIKARVRRVQREMVRKRMLAAVPTATVVITNPTHYAVALEYRRGEMLAPMVVAKGKDLLAQRIKQVARDHGVPTVENVPLAQALYKGAEVGDAIPAGLFGAVAEVLAYLVRIRQLML